MLWLHFITAITLKYFPVETWRDWVALSQSRKLPGMTRFIWFGVGCGGGVWRETGQVSFCDLSRAWALRISGHWVQPFTNLDHLNSSLVVLLIWWPWEIYIRIYFCLFVCFLRKLLTWMSFLEVEKYSVCHLESKWIKVWGRGEWGG